MDGSPYSYLTYGKPMSMGRRIAVEIKDGIERDEFRKNNNIDFVIIFCIFKSCFFHLFLKLRLFFSFYFYRYFVVFHIVLKLFTQLLFVQAQQDRQLHQQIRIIKATHCYYSGFCYERIRRIAPYIPITNVKTTMGC